MLKFWFLAIILTTVVVLVGLLGIFNTVVMNDPDEWLSIGQFADSVIALLVSLLTFKALSK